MTTASTVAQYQIEVRMRSLAPKASRRRLRADQLLRWFVDVISSKITSYSVNIHEYPSNSILMLFQTSQRIDIYIYYIGYIVLDLPWTYAFSGNRWLCYHFWSSQAGARWETVYRGFNKWWYPKIPKWKLYNGKSYIIKWIILGYPRFLGNQYIYIYIYMYSICM